MVKITRVSVLKNFRLEVIFDDGECGVIDLSRLGWQMIIEYCQNAIENANYKKLEDGTWFAEIPGFDGVWANGASVETCRKELIEVLEEWLILKLRDNDPDTNSPWVEN